MKNSMTSEVNLCKKLEESKNNIQRSDLRKNNLN